MLREMPGGRWRRIVEQRLPDGSLLAFSTDVTDLVRRALTGIANDGSAAPSGLIPSGDRREAA